MRFQDIKKLAPASVPVATVAFREHPLDIFPITGEDIFWLLNVAPAVAKAWSDGEDDGEADKDAAANARLLATLQAVGEAGPAVMNRLLCTALRTTEAELAEAGLVADEQIEILSAFLANGIPEDLLGKLVLGARAGAVRAGLRMPAFPQSAPSAASSTASSQEASTPTA
jgi:hypothetical protein